MRAIGRHKHEVYAFTNKRNFFLVLKIYKDQISKKYDKDNNRIYDITFYVRHSITKSFATMSQHKMSYSYHSDEMIIY